MCSAANAPFRVHGPWKNSWYHLCFINTCMLECVKCPPPPPSRRTMKTNTPYAIKLKQEMGEIFLCLNYSVSCFPQCFLFLYLAEHRHVP